MVIKKPVYKQETRVHNVVVSPAKLGCDCCKKEIKEEKVLKLQVFHKNGPTEYFEYCSWKCLLKHLSVIKTDYFISLPFLNYDNNNTGVQAKELIKLIKKLKL